MSTTESQGVLLIAAERERQQTVEGYDAAHDAGHSNEIALAAAVYAQPYPWRDIRKWPWAAEFYKPTPEDRVRELVKSGALIAAAIDAEIAATDG